MLPDRLKDLNKPCLQNDYTCHSSMKSHKLRLVNSLFHYLRRWHSGNNNNVFSLSPSYENITECYIFSQYGHIDLT